MKARVELPSAACGKKQAIACVNDEKHDRRAASIKHQPGQELVWPPTKAASDGQSRAALGLVAVIISP